MKPFLFGALFSFAIFSCQKPEAEPKPVPQPVQLSSDKTTLSLGGNENNIDSFIIQSTSKWNLSLPTAITWLKPSVTSGAAGTTKVYLTILQNNKTGAERMATINVTPEGVTSPQQTISVTQKVYAAAQWKKLYGGTKNDMFTTAFPTDDGGYLLVDGSESGDGDLSSNKGSADAWIVKVNDQGTIQWQKSYGGSDHDRLYGIVSSGDGGYLLTGVTSSSNGDVRVQHGDGDVWIIKIDGAGNLLWEKTYGGSSSDYATGLVRTPDGGYIIQANSGSSDGDVTGKLPGVRNLYDYWIFKIDASGNKRWDKSFGGSEIDISTGIIAVSGGGYLITGYVSSSDGDAAGTKGRDDAMVVKIDDTGNKQWAQLYGGSAFDQFSAVTQTPDGGFMLVGMTSSNDGDVTGNKGANDFWIVKVDGSGNKVWQRTFGGTDREWVSSVIATEGGGYLLTGTTYSRDGDISTNKGDSDVWLLKINDSGSILWQQTFGGTTQDIAWFMRQDLEGNFILVGQSKSNNGDAVGNHGEADAWAVRFKVP